MGLRRIKQTPVPAVRGKRLGLGEEVEAEDKKPAQQAKKDGRKDNLKNFKGKAAPFFEPGKSGNPRGKHVPTEPITSAYRRLGESEMTEEELREYATAGHMTLENRKACRDYIKALEGSFPHTREINDRRQGPVTQKVKLDADVKTKSRVKHEVKIKPNTMEDILRIAAECGPGKADHADASGNPKPAGDEVHGPGHAGPDSKAT
jgi:hypothetical protein